ncbi:MAG: ankyrin repeat domain-containing protein, partial [Pseudomonadota bacterium]|nr:ankyrin repeat domain-containing protein [Pseudomonadota bacterium]
MLERLLDSGLPVDELNDFGRTPLNLACKYDRAEAVRFLISRKANINFDDDYDSRGACRTLPIHN